MRKLFTTAFHWAIRRLPERYRERMFTALAGALGVESFVVGGPLGKFEGAVDDEMAHGFYFLNRTWAPALQEILAGRLFLEGKGIFIDAGANIGLTTIPLAITRGVQCHAFEPEARNNAFLRKNVIANGVEDRVHVHGVALNDADRELVFELSATNMGDHRVRVAEAGESSVGGLNLYDEHLRKTTRVPGRRLDGVLDASKLSGPVAMKVDTQGSEVKVLRGAPLLLAKLDALIIEYWPYGLRRAGDAPEALIELVRPFPYAIAYKDAETVATLRPVEEVLASMRALADGGGHGWLDLIFSRTETL